MKLLIYSDEMPQCFPAASPDAPKREMPTMAIEGAIVNGVMKRRIKPTIPDDDWRGMIKLVIDGFNFIV